MKLFVSYSRVDKPSCIAIVDLLRAHDVWFDHRLYGGDKWWDEIVHQLEQCDGFVYLLSNESVSSEYCIKEFEIANELGKQIIPVLVRARTQIPNTLKSLNDLHQIDLAEINVYSVTELLNAVLQAERLASQPKKKLTSNPLNKSKVPLNFVHWLENQVNLSELTVSTYLRWTEDFLVNTGGYKESSGKPERKKRMQELSINLLIDCLNIVQIKAWLRNIIAYRNSSVGAVQAKAAIKQLITQLLEIGYLEPIILQELDAISIPKQDINPLSRRNLSLAEIKLLISATVDMATSDNQAKRNKLLILMFSYLLMKPHEVAKITWKQTDTNKIDQTLSIYKPNAYLTVKAPKFAYEAYTNWMNCFDKPSESTFSGTPIIRAIHKGGNIASQGMGTRGILKIVEQAALHTNLGEVTPLDIRHSVAQIMVKEKIFPVDIVSRLVGHARGSAASQLFDKTHAKHAGEVIFVPDFLS